MIAAAIVACEIGFWVVLGAGLALRYPLRRPGLGALVLAGVPVVDVVLLVMAGADLAGGARFTGSHGLAATYLGFSLAFGPALVRWADVRFAHRYAGGPAPAPRPAAGSRARRAALWTEWRRVLLAVVIASAVLGALALLADADQRRTVLASAGPLWVVAAIWLVAGPLWEEGRRVVS